MLVIRVGHQLGDGPKILFAMLLHHKAKHNLTVNEMLTSTAFAVRAYIGVIGFIYVLGLPIHTYLCVYISTRFNFYVSVIGIFGFGPYRAALIAGRLVMDDATSPA